MGNLIRLPGVVDESGMTAEEARAAAVSPEKKSLLRRIAGAIASGVAGPDIGTQSALTVDPKTGEIRTVRAGVRVPRILRILPFSSNVIAALDEQKAARIGLPLQAEMLKRKMAQEEAQAEQERVQTAAMKAPKIFVRNSQVFQTDPITGTITQVEFKSDKEAIGFINGILQGIEDPTTRAKATDGVAFHVSQGNYPEAAKIATAASMSEAGRKATIKSAEWIRDVDSRSGFSRLYRDGTGEIARVERDLLPPSGYIPTTTTRQQVIQLTQPDGTVKYVTVDLKSTTQKGGAGGGVAPPPKSKVTLPGVEKLPPGAHDTGLTSARKHSGQEASRAAAAVAIIPLVEDANRMLSDPAIRARLGVLPGRVSEIEKILGNLDPDVADLYGTLKSIYSLGGTMHGWRALQVAQEFEKAYGGLHTNPDATMGGLRAMNKTARSIAQAGGRGYEIGQVVPLKNGKNIKVTKVYPDGTFDGEEIK